MKEERFAILALFSFLTGFGLVVLGSLGITRYLSSFNECLVTLGGSCAALAGNQDILIVSSSILLFGGMLFFAGVIFLATAMTIQTYQRHA